MEKSPLLYIVDDSADYRFLLQDIFMRYMPTYQVRFFESGDALTHHALRSTDRPSLILLDLNMPGRDGLGTLQLLKQHPGWKVIPVVMVTNHVSPEEQEACYCGGANSCLQKPIGLEPLRKLLETTCHYWITLNQPTAIPYCSN